MPSSTAEMSAATNLEWIDTLGGPLIAMPRAVVGLWSGYEPPTDGRVIEASFRCGPDDEPATDYDRACSVREDIGALQVGGGWAVVLTGTPPMACYIPRADGSMFVVWDVGESEEAISTLLRNPPLTGWQDTGTTIVHEGGLVQLFDSVAPGCDSDRDPEDYQIFPLSRGSYSIWSNEWEPDSQTRLVLHRLTQVED